jgi:hypothetical protein
MRRNFAGWRRESFRPSRLHSVGPASAGSIFLGKQRRRLLAVVIIVSIAHQVASKSASNMLGYNFHPPELIKCVRLRALLQRWDLLRGDEALPPPGGMNRDNLELDFDMMARIEVFNVHYKPRFRVIEHGTALREMYGAESLGQFIDEVFSEKIGGVSLESYMKALEKKTPIYTIWNLRDGGGHLVTEERLLLPFGEPLLGVTEFWLAIETRSTAADFARENMNRPLAPPEVVMKIAVDPGIASFA